MWRLARGLTQAELARRARLARPNLSAIERGRREVSLGTLRALAAGLDINPGTLVDGLSPWSARQSTRPCSRDRLERIAEAVVTGGDGEDPEERRLIRALRRLTAARAAAATRRWGGERRGKRATVGAWLLLSSGYPREMVQSLIQRVMDRQHAKADG